MPGRCALWHHHRRVEVLTTAASLRDWRESLAPARRVALVPTMGFLHAGHRSLLEAGREHVPQGAGELVLTIFVNPTQFGPNEDLASYPRDEASDLQEARGAAVDVVFLPRHPEELYAKDASTWVDVGVLDRHLCGAHRPGHFRGVCTIVCKLWGLVRPDVTIFGEKDYQQLAIVRRMHRDLFLSGTVVGRPIVRESDGLAMSSRNANLSPEDRRHAGSLWRWLQAVQARFQSGERRAEALLADVSGAVAPGRIDYAQLVDVGNLQPLDVVDRPALCALAVRFGPVRLIDNLVLRP